MEKLRKELKSVALENGDFVNRNKTKKKAATLENIFRAFLILESSKCLASSFQTTLGKI